MSETRFSKIKISGPVTFSLELVSLPRNRTANKCWSQVIIAHVPISLVICLYIYW